MQNLSLSEIKFNDLYDFLIGIVLFSEGLYLLAKFKKGQGLKK